MKTTGIISIIVIILVIVVVAGIILFNNKTEMFDTGDEMNDVSENTGMNSVPESQSDNVSNPKIYTINIEDYAYKPKTLEIKKGDTVIWTNKDSVGHTVTSDSGNELDSKLLADGETYSHTFNNRGEFDYYCKPHPYMKGGIIVK